MGKNARQNIPRAQRDIARLLRLYNQKSKTPKLLIIYFIYLSCCWLENYSLSVQLLKSSHGKNEQIHKIKYCFFSLSNQRECVWLHCNRLLYFLRSRRSQSVC